MSPQAESPESLARAQARALLGRAQAIHAQLDEAAPSEPGAARKRMAAIIANLAAAEIELGVVADGPGTRSGANLNGIAMLLQGSEAAAAEAIQQAETEAANGRMDDGALDARSKVAGYANELFERKVFDPYLHFNSIEEETAYREREAQRKRAMEAALAEHTAHGDHRAAVLVYEQTVDAGAHGATASPDYQRVLYGTAGLVQRTQAAAAREGTHKEEGTPAGDASLDRGLRTVLKATGASDADIEKVLNTADPKSASAEYLAKHAPPRADDHSPAASAKIPIPGGVTGTPGATRPADDKKPDKSTATAAHDMAQDVDLAAMGVSTDAPPPVGGHGLPEQLRKEAAKADGKRVS